MKRYFLLFFILVTVVLGFYFYQAPIPFEELKSKYADEDSHFIDLNNLSVHYKKKGTGFPILLIHGTSSSLHTWEPWEKELSKEYTTYSIDMQGGGLTTPPEDNDYSIDAYIALIDTFIAALEIDSFYLIGNSLGGHTAWAYAANSKNASKVKKLVLLDPSGFFDPNKDKPLAFQLVQFDFVFNNIEHLNIQPMVNKSLKDVFYNDDLISNDLKTRYYELGTRAGNRKAFGYKIKELATANKKDLQKITCPTLIQWGEEDAWIPISLAQIFIANIPNNQFISYPKCGHVPMEEIPETSVQDVLRFFQE